MVVVGLAVAIAEQNEEAVVACAWNEDKHLSGVQLGATESVDLASLMAVAS